MQRKERKNQDVAIVGGSAAGMFTAYLLARAGKQVRVFEGGSQLDQRHRTLIVTGRMPEVIGTIASSAIVGQIRRFELFTDGRVAQILLRRPDLVIERSKLIRALAEAAQNAGAQIQLGRRFVSFRNNPGKLALALDRAEDGATEEFQAQTIVAADGAASRVAREAGWPTRLTVPLIQAVVQLPRGTPPDTTRVWFIPEDTPYFYWLIPESPSKGVLGLIGEDGPTIRRALERFLEKQGLTPSEFQAARVPLYTQWTPVRRRLADGEVYVVGDAAGHVKVTTVGGIVTGFRGALGVADAILNDGSNGRLRALRWELDLHLLIRKTLQNFTQAHYSGLVDLLNARARRDLEMHTRDEPGKLLWNLCLHQPRLLLLGLRALLGRRSSFESLK